jgi:hypothetical protein
LALNDIKAAYDAELIHTSAGLVIKATEGDPQLILPDNGVIDGAKNGVVLRVTIESQIETQMKLFYKTTKDKKYTGSNSAIVSLQKGLNQLDMIIFDQDIDGQLRLDPANMPGEYIVKKLVLYPIF